MKAEISPVIPNIAGLLLFFRKLTNEEQYFHYYCYDFEEHNIK